MGGFGSGRPWRGGGKRKAERTPAIDINRLNAEGRLRPGLVTVTFSQPRGLQIGVKGAADEVVLFIRPEGESGQGEATRQTLEIVRAPCRFGGSRPYFVCGCGCKTVKLFAAGTYFRCRRCYRLAYACQNEDGEDRARRRALKLRRRIGGNDCVGEPLPFIKPKFMQARTFSRLYESANKAKTDAIIALAAQAERLFGFRS